MASPSTKMMWYPSYVSIFPFFTSNFPLFTQLPRVAIIYVFDYLLHMMQFFKDGQDLHAKLEASNIGKFLSCFIPLMFSFHVSRFSFLFGILSSY